MLVTAHTKNPKSVESSQQIPNRRERKKSKQRQELTSVAISLFVEHGYEEVKMEDVAKMADVATSTLYKYFPSKRSLLLAVAKWYADDTAERVKNFTPDPCANVFENIMEQTRIVWGAPMPTGEKRLWCHIRAAYFQMTESETHFFESNRQRYAELIRSLLVSQQDSGLIAQSADLHVLANAIHAIGLYGFSRYLTVNDLSLETALSEVRSQIAAVLFGWLSDSDMA